MSFFPTTLKKFVVACIIVQPTIPIENTTEEHIWSRDTWKKSYFIIKNLIMNGLTNEIYDYYSAMSIAKEVWNALQKKYDTKEVGSKKYAVNQYLQYQMTNDR